MQADNHRLFFALQPTAAVAAQIAHAAESAKPQRGVRVRWLSATHYHLTVHYLGNHAGTPHAIIDQARTAAESTGVSAFELVLDRIDRFPGRAQRPWVLRCSDNSEPPLGRLHRQLGKALAEAGLGSLLEERFTPHVTIAYGTAVDAMPIAITPIVWPVSEFVLMQSRAGQAQYDTLARWPLVSVHASGSAPDSRPA